MNAGIKSASVFLGLFVLSGSCIEPFNVALPDNRGYVVIDGLITDQPGPYTIKLFRPNSLNDQLTTVNWVKGASLVIDDDLNHSVALTERAPGNYETDSNFRGIVGRTYTLKITISDAERYESLPQKLLPVGQIEKVYHEFVQVEDSTTSNFAEEPKNGFYIYLDGDVLPEQNKLARWRTVGTYEILTFPANRKVPGDGHDIPPVMVPDPPPCSGIVCTCCTCWPSIHDEQPILSEPEFLNNNHVERLKLAFVPARKDYFSKKYYFRVEQMSVTPEAYDYWQNIRKEGGTGTDLFQTPAARTVSNMRAVGNTKTPMLGLFGVSSIQRVSFFIDRKEVPYHLWDPPRFEDSCMKLTTRDNTNVKPAYWN